MNLAEALDLLEREDAADGPTDDDIDSRAEDILRKWLHTPICVEQWLHEVSPKHMESAPVPVDAAWLVPLDGNHAKLLETQPTWVLRGLVWAGTDAQVQAAALLIRGRFCEAMRDLARAEAEGELREEFRRAA